MSFDPDLRAHQEWLGYLQPVGLVVAPPALLRAQAVLSRNLIGLQQRLLELVTPIGDDGDLGVADLPTLLVELLGWQRGDLVEPPEALEVALPAYGDALRPTLAVPDPEAGPDDNPWLMLIQVVSPGQDLDEAPEGGVGWCVSPQERFERLLRDTGVSTGLLCDHLTLRLVYAPKGELSGHLSFPIAAMAEVSGRIILGGLELLLCAERVFDPDKSRRLTGVLEESRKHQATVSTRLSGQVLDALQHLLRGFQAADDARGGALLRELIALHPEDLYGGLLTVLMRLVFLLYAEHGGLMPKDPVYLRNYSVSGLYDRLRADVGNHPDTMDQRYGAWGHLLSLFRLVHQGGGHAGLRLPERRGELFEPNRYAFLEGRPQRDKDPQDPQEQAVEAPRVSDGVVWRVLHNLLVLDGEQLSYRALNVEDIGSVYEAIMGFAVERMAGAAIALRPKDVVVDLDALLRVKPRERSKRLVELADCKLGAAMGKALESADTVPALVAALGRRISPHTPTALPPGSLVLQPGVERRRTGSHYTPRKLTEPIVATTLRPLLEALGDRPTPEMILDLRLCDPAMGSGAFLVETCRQLADRLVKAWEDHGRLPELPADEEPWLHARRLVAQRCVYGVDKNPFAVSLAKLSLWLVTLARDHSFTFVDHALKHGDSLVGFGKVQISTFRWDGKADHSDLSLTARINVEVGRAKTLRAEIGALGDGDYKDKHEAHKGAEAAIGRARRRGDLLVAAFFGGEDPKRRERRRGELLELWARYEAGDIAAAEEVKGVLEALRGGEHPVPPLHWELEFPEVFDRENSGFDGIVGNPPFMGKNTLAAASRAVYPDWLKWVHAGSHGNADLVAHFFRRAFGLLRDGGAFGLIATNTIAQGDTRSTGLTWIRGNGGWIYEAKRRYKWPGLAAVVVSVVHVRKDLTQRHRGTEAVLDGKRVERVSAFLFSRGTDTDPSALIELADMSFVGSYILGLGFTFDDTSPEANPISEMHRLIAADPRNAERIFPYIGGDDLNSNPSHEHSRYVINFGDMTEDEARRWPDLMEVVERRVKPARIAQNREIRARYWWRFGEPTPALFRAIEGLGRILAVAQTSKWKGWVWLPNGMVYDQKLIVFTFDTWAAVAVLQSSAHEVWWRFFGQTLEDRPVYSPSDCFETFPFPPDWTTSPALEAAGQTYYEYRAALMVRNNQGLTATYNRFHDPEEHDPEIQRLRELHDAMDHAVAAAYGWQDIIPRLRPEFILDYEDEDDDDDDGGARRKKKPWRLRWPDDVRDEVLARLLALNQQRAEAERLAALTGDKPAPKAQAPKKSPKKAPPRAAEPPTNAPLSLFADRKEPR